MMSQRSEFITSEGTAFIGRVTASVSHELKNVLATISETAGLLSDLLELAAHDRDLDREELLSCSGTITNQIRRGFTVVKSLNVFAHSSDHPVTSVDLNQVVQLVRELASYLSYASSVELESDDAVPIMVTTRPLLLEDLVYRVVVAAFRSAGPNGSIRLTTGIDPSGAAITVSGLSLLDSDTLVDDDLEQLMLALGTELRGESSNDAVRILLPPHLDIQADSRE